MTYSRTDTQIHTHELKKDSWAVLVHSFKPNTREAEAVKSLSLGLVWATNQVL